ncbi:PPK2 family polyphosphate kinase [Haematomicrobium sanguinis]|uniref:PPK2 family polyphosphate kinase n=1 Tax=Haematomicrobium sanguinis TaxID=479106 RepID=UPI00068F9A3E|nr:PPK2 family polyphosphate kinase [Haematomicrobium sanguinis]
MAKNLVTFSESPTELLRATPDFDLASIDTSSTPGFTGKKRDGEKLLAAGATELADLQEQLFANGKFGDNRSVLLILQAMDTAGKGGITKHVVGAVDPQGVSYHAFKAPTEEEKQHDFLWRIEKQVPARGMIGVFDRSQYEDVLIHRVRKFSPPEEIERRYGAIVDFENNLAAAGTKVIKVMLHISSATQKERLTERLDREDKWWKYSPGDVDERLLWPAYQEAYQIAIERTTTDTSPWFVVPADRKWYARIAVQQLLLDALRSFDLGWPEADFDVAEEKKRLAAT